MRHRVAGLLSICLFALSGCIGDAYVGVDGTVMDQSGSPLAGVTVTLKPAPGSDCDASPDSRTTPSSGEFANLLTFSGSVRKRDFVLQASKDGYTTQSITIHSDNDVMRDLVITLLKREKEQREDQTESKRHARESEESEGK